MSDMPNWLLTILKAHYQDTKLNDKSLLEWAVLWFKTDNDTFFDTYGFNFNPHEYNGLYEVAQKEVFKDDINDWGA